MSEHVHFNDPESKKSIGFGLIVLALFGWLASLSMPRVSRESPEIIVVAIIECLVLLITILWFLYAWLPHNFHANYVWYWKIRHKGFGGSVVGDNVFDKQKISDKDISFQVKTSGWFAKNQLLHCR